jgi:Nucleotide-diphospho-sugar transferase
MCGGPSRHDRLGEGCVAQCDAEKANADHLCPFHQGSKPGGLFCLNAEQVMDLDIVLLRNPLDLVYARGDSDVLISTDQRLLKGDISPNTGFYFIRSSDSTRELLRRWLALGYQDIETWEQPLFWKARRTFRQTLFSGF